MEGDDGWWGGGEGKNGIKVEASAGEKRQLTVRIVSKSRNHFCDGVQHRSQYLLWFLGPDGFQQAHSDRVLWERLWQRWGREGGGRDKEKGRGRSIMRV